MPEPKTVTLTLAEGMALFHFINEVPQVKEDWIRIIERASKAAEVDPFTLSNFLNQAIDKLNAACGELN